MLIGMGFSSLTSSGTFSHSPLVAAASSFFGFCLSFLLNENERNDKNRFFDFFGFFAESVAAVASSPAFSAPSLLSSNVPVVVSAAFSVASSPPPFSAGFSASGASALAAAGSAAAGSLFSVAASFSFSAASSFFSSCFSLGYRKH